MLLISNERQPSPLGEVLEAYSVPVSPRRTVLWCLRSRSSATPLGFALVGWRSLLISFPTPRAGQAFLSKKQRLAFLFLVSIVFVLGHPMFVRAVGVDGLTRLYDGCH